MLLHYLLHIAHLWQCHTTKFVTFLEKLLKDLKCCNFLWVQLRHNCSPAASFANCVMTLYLLKVQIRTFLYIPITQKMPNFELWHSCCKWAIGCSLHVPFFVVLYRLTVKQQCYPGCCRVGRSQKDKGVEVPAENTRFCYIASPWISAHWMLHTNQCSFNTIIY